jgi:type IV pilus assembly protein PilB
MNQPPTINSDATADALQQKLRKMRFKEKEREIENRANVVGLPYFNLDGFPINPDSVAVIPEQESKALGLVCFWYSIGDLRLGTINPNSSEVQDKIEELAEEMHTVPKVYLISLESLRIAQETYKRVPRRGKVVSNVEISERELKEFSSQIAQLADVEKGFAHASTTQSVVVMIAGALKTNATDIHIEAGPENVQLRYRIDGVLYPVAKISSATYTKMVSRLKLLSKLKINIADVPQDGRFTINLEKASNIDVRVSTLPTAHGESIVMRLLRWGDQGVGFDQLGIEGQARQKLEEEMTKAHGMILTTGPTGAGKTTTLYSILKVLNKPGVKIITIEDPIEYRLPGVNQSQVDTKRKYTFASGLRSIVRQDPNVVMVGEIRDLETADIAVNAAQTGHLVLSTLHTNSASGAVPRLVNLGLQPFVIPSSTNAIMGQRLVRRLCQTCRKIVELDEVGKQHVQNALDTLPEQEKNRVPKEKKVYQATGCEDCQGIGYKGQIGIFEVLVMTQKIEDAIIGTKVTERSLESLAVQEGMATMFQDGILKVLAGVTTLEEVLRVTQE